MNEKKSRLAITLLVCIVFAAVVLLACAGAVYQKSLKVGTKSAKQQEAALKAKKAETKETEKKSESKASEDTSGANSDFKQVEEAVWVIAQSANCRKTPSPDGEVVGKVPNMRMLTRYEVSKDWSKIQLSTIGSCYISNKDISTKRPEGAGDSVVESTALADGAIGASGSAAGGSGKEKIICIDPGHQAHGDSRHEPIGPGASETKARVSSGTSGAASGLDEYQLNLTVSLKLRDELESRGYKVVMTRETHDVNIGNQERAAFAKEHNADILVRIHANGSDNASVNGALTMAPSADNPFLSSDLISESQRLSQKVIDSYCAATGFANQGVYETDKMSGINWASMPVTIVEMGYMTNASDDLKMADPAMQTKIVKGICDGIDQYYS